MGGSQSKTNSEKFIDAESGDIDVGVECFGENLPGQDKWLGGEYCPDNGMMYCVPGS